MTTKTNYFSEADLRNALRATFETPDDRFLLTKWDRKRKGDTCQWLGDASSLGFNFELDEKRVRPDSEVGWFISIRVGSICQKVFLGLPDQNATYSEIAERIETFMPIE